MPPTLRARDRKIAAAFGKRLRQLRLDAGMTQERLAEAAGLHPTYISNTERGYSCPTIYTVARLAKALKLDAGDLVRGLEA